MPDLEPFAPDRNSSAARLPPLKGCKILVVEDEHLIAQDLEVMLEDAGANVVGPVDSLPKAIRLAGDTERIDVALLNVFLNGDTVFPLVDQLQGRRVPILFLTGYDEANIPKQYSNIPRCEKPARPGRVVEELTALLRPLPA